METNWAYHGPRRPERKLSRTDGLSSLNLCPASLREIEILVRHRRAMWRALHIRKKTLLDKADKEYAAWARARLRSSRLKAWIVKDNNGKIAGSGCVWLQSIQPRPGNPLKVQPYLLSMYTEPVFRRRGVASLIVEEAIDWSRKNGYQRLLLHASETGKKVYRKYGFKRTWEMRLRLPAATHTHRKNVSVRGAQKSGRSFPN